MQALRLRKTAEKVGVHPMTVRRWATEERYSGLAFPKPIKLGDNSIAFIEEEVDRWLKQRMSERGTAA